MPLILKPTIVEGKVYRGKKKTEEDEERQALSELQSLLNAKNRRSCDCEAQLHDLLENCLNCGRLTCEVEGPGKCFSCGNLVLNQEQRDRLKKHIDMIQPCPSASQKDQQSSGPRVRLIDSQFDTFAIDDKRHLREDDKRRLKENLEELQSKRYQRQLVLNVDIDNLEAGASSEPVVDYTAEMRKLQISQPVDRGSNPTLVEKFEQRRDLKREPVEEAKSSQVNLQDTKNRGPPDSRDNNNHPRQNRDRPRGHQRGSRGPGRPKPSQSSKRHEPNNSNKE